MIEKFNGIFPALITPYTKHNKIHKKSLEELVQINLNKGVKGFYVGGSTAEAFLLSHEERKEILEIVAGEAKGKCTLIAHIGCISTDQAIELAKHAKQVGVDAVSSITPFYYKFTFEEIKQYYMDIVNAVELPMILYNFPAFSGTTLTTQNLKEMASDSRIVGVKHTSMDLYQLERMTRISDKLAIFNGHDEVYLGSLAMGATGAVGSTYNFMAERFIKIKQLFEQNKMEEAQRLQIEANGIIELMSQGFGLSLVKAVLEIMGIECNGFRRPFRQLTKDEKQMIKVCLDKNNILKT